MASLNLAMASSMLALFLEDDGLLIQGICAPFVVFRNFCQGEPFWVIFQQSLLCDILTGDSPL